MAVEAMETVTGAVAEGEGEADGAMEEEEATVEETVAAKTANLSQSSLAPQSTNSSAQAFQSRAVVLFLGRSVRPHRSNSVARCQNKAAGPCPERFLVNNAPTSQDSSAVQCQNRAADLSQNRAADRCRNRAVGQFRNRAVDRCRSSNAKMFLDSSADRFQKRNALWFLDSSAEVSQVKSVPQCLVNRVAASLARAAGMFQSKNVATSQGSSVGRCQKRAVDRCQNRAVVQCQNRAADRCRNRAVDLCLNRAASRCQDSSAGMCPGNSAGLCQNSLVSRCRSSRARMSVRMSSGAKFATTDKRPTEQEEAIFRRRARTAILTKLSLQSNTCIQQKINDVWFSNKAFLGLISDFISTAQRCSKEGAWSVLSWSWPCDPRPCYILVIGCWVIQAFCLCLCLHADSEMREITCLRIYIYT